MVVSSTQVAIVDDDAGVRKALSRLLAASAMDSALYATGNDFLASLATRTPDCVVLDLKMPGLDGIDVLRQLAGVMPRLPVIVLTAHEAPDAERDCLRAGAAVYLRKPCDGARLVAEISRVTAMPAPG
jgi:two-component system nitrogen regulation response regulator GlnG